MPAKHGDPHKKDFIIMEKYLLGYDVGTSSVKAALVSVSTGQVVCHCQYPEGEAAIESRHPGWAEQRPEDWWQSLCAATRGLLAKSELDGADIAAIGISYQMHGLVCVDARQHVLRPAIIWCDSRAVGYGARAFDGIGHERCLRHLLNSPANFTASKLAWVKEHEPEIYAQVHKIMLPGDYIAMRLSGGCLTTTQEGLSEGVLWDFETRQPSRDVLDFFGFAPDILPEATGCFDTPCAVAADVAAEIGLKAGTPISYRAGDQPNNALSLGVLHTGEVAATGGTSGVVFGVTDKLIGDPQNRVNTFAHVNYRVDSPMMGVLLCINGVGILNAWLRRNMAGGRISYDEMNGLAAALPIGAEELSVIPFGNGAERLLGNRDLGSAVMGIDFNRHTQAHLFRAGQEGIAFAFRRGISAMEGMGMDVNIIHAGHANLFLSDVFTQTLCDVSGAEIRLYDTDGAAGAARGAGIGAGIYATAEEACASLRLEKTVTPDPAHREACQAAYDLWTRRLEGLLAQR